MIRKQIIFIPTVLFFALILAGSVSAANETWHNESLSAQQGGYVPDSLALDSSGNPHISYYNITSDSLMYCSENGSKWVNETVDTGIHVDYISLALDSAGNPRIAYLYGGGSVNYAYKYAGTWYKETVTTNSNEDGTISLALDSTNTPHITYTDSGSAYNHLVYASLNNNNTWNMQNVDTAPYGFAGMENSLKINSNGTPCISYTYQVGSNAVLRYASKTGTTWSIITLANSTTDSYRCPSIALNSNGAPCISYVDQTTGALMYTHWLMGWFTQTVDTGSISDNSLAIDSLGHPHISYMDNWTLKYAYNNGTNWIKKLVDTTYTGGDYNSLALDSIGKPHILSSTGYGELRYAYIPPVVKSTDPLNKAVNVSPGKVIKVTFSEAIKNLNKSLIVLKNPKGTNISFSTSINTTNNVLTITPTTPMTTGTYNLILHTGCVKDFGGNPLALYTSIFKVDATPPTVTSFDPVNGSVSVPDNKVIKVTFSEAVKAGNNNIVLTNSNGTPVALTFSIVGNVLTINHAALLTTGKYTLTLHTGCVTDLAGNSFALKSISFHTT